ncbi:GTP diphosphokinase [Entomoplasma ellychniae]|uniref:Penta-phosphate guanosine-3'-pyrophosphohydrolase n=1 Tax=Entomoplasma ellychniae TaxID=2114 RepID=A0A8E2QWN9_9MOLU|nr:RelA/SpoT family protein [Entomoplasma ellychniae]PPE05067.1 GTP diphosphokinase [Entomoplasma ellychniae]
MSASKIKNTNRASTNLNIIEIKEFDVLKQEVSKYIKDENIINDIHKAYIFAEKMHATQKRKNGDPYIYHPLSTSYYLAQLEMGPKTIIAGLLHDVIEDTPITKKEISDMFGEEVAELVDSVTKVSFFEEDNREKIKSEYLRKLYISMAKDIRVIIIKIADRLHNMLTISNMSLEKQKLVAQETLNIYSAIAHRIGMKNAKSKLEDMSFAVLQPKDFQYIVKLLDENKQTREKDVEKTINNIYEFLTKEKNVKILAIFGREKTHYSIYRKMSVNGKEFEQIHDLTAIRIITKSIDDCYKVLGFIHQKYIPLSGRFKDYIATPKNGVYQSLHTTVADNNNMIFEVQIRTNKMDDVAESGAAAHWRYKDNEIVDVAKRQKEIDEQIDVFTRILDITDQADENENNKDLEKQLQQDIFASTIYVLTPNQQVITLPYGATVLDFAYRIHTEIGEKTTGAKIDGSFSPINTVLKSGQVIEVKTSSKQQPTHEWLKIVITTNARNRIRKYLNNKFNEDKGFENERKEAAIKAQHIINSFINQKDWKWKKISIDQTTELVKKDGYASLEEFLISIARGEFPIAEAVDKYYVNQSYSKDDETLRTIASRTINDKTLKNDIVIEGITNIKTSIAICCLPIPYEDVVGYVTKSGNGIKVHMRKCFSLNSLVEQNKRLVEVKWNEAVTINNTYRTKIRYFATDRPNLLYDISRVLTNSKATTINIKMGVDPKTLIASGVLTVQVKSVEQLNQIIASIKSLANLIDCERDVKVID